MAVDEGFSVTPATAVPTSGLDLAKLASGRVVEARVASLAEGIALVASRHGTLQVDLSQFGDRSPAVGDGVRLQVQAVEGGGKPAITVVEHTPAVGEASAARAAAEDPALVLAQAVRNAAATQSGLAPLYASLAGLAAAPQGSVPEPVRALVAQLMGARLAEGAAPSAETVRKAFAGSGIFLESRLAAGPGRSAAPAEDLKAALFSLRAALEKWVGGSPAGSVASGGGAPAGPSTAKAVATTAGGVPERPPTASAPTGAASGEGGLGSGLGRLAGTAYGGGVVSPPAGSERGATASTAAASGGAPTPTTAGAAATSSVPTGPDTSPNRGVTVAPSDPAAARSAPSTPTVSVTTPSPPSAVPPAAAGAVDTVRPGAGGEGAAPQQPAVTSPPPPIPSPRSPSPSPSIPPPPSPPPLGAVPSSSVPSPSVPSPPAGPVSPASSAPTSSPAAVPLATTPLGGSVGEATPVAGSPIGTPFAPPTVPSPAGSASPGATSPLPSPAGSASPGTTDPPAPLAGSSPPGPPPRLASVAASPAGGPPSSAAGPSVSRFAVEAGSTTPTGGSTDTGRGLGAVAASAVAVPLSPSDAVRGGEVASEGALVPPVNAGSPPAVAPPNPTRGEDDAVTALLKVVVRGLEIAGSLTSTRPSEAGEVAAALAAIGSERELKPPPPRRGQATRGQAAQPIDGIGEGGVEGLAKRTLERTEGALSRILLEQFAALDRRPEDPTRPTEVGSQRQWTAEMPIATSAGTGVVQMTVERDGGRTRSGEASASTGWRVRFSLDVEPLGPIHARIGLSGEKLSIGLWAERPDAAARLGSDVGRLQGALEAAAIPVESIHLATGRPASSTAAATAGRFVDVKL